MKRLATALTLALVAGLLVVAAPAWTAPTQATRTTQAPLAAPATGVPKSTCKRIDPNLVNGVCLRYPTARGGTAYTWIGTYRAANGRIFFCIDYLYDSRLPRRAQTRLTTDLRNQMGDRIRPPEIAALNYLISRWAGRGSTGSDTRDAAIALIIREVMSDGIRGDGVVVYPRGLQVGESVRRPRGGLSDDVMGTANKMWKAASKFYGGYRLELTTRQKRLRLGRTRTYRASVWSAAGKRVPGVRIRFRCSGPISCPKTLSSRAKPVRVTVRPRRTGRFRIKAIARGPAADGKLYVVASWRGHNGTRARRAGTQRGWIARRNTAQVAVSDRAIVARGRPEVTTITSEALVVPGATIHDVVEVRGLPQGYRQQVAARLFGPYVDQPGPGDCAPAELAGEVSFEVNGDGTYQTPEVVVSQVGHYVWTESLPGDERTVPVTTPCGIVEETTRVEKLTPDVTTVASDQRAHVGNRIHDTIDLTGIGQRPVRIEWMLRGPVAPRNGGCADLWWSRAGVADQGAIDVPGDGRYRTPSTSVTASGCYTYSEEIAETATTHPASSPPGIPAETALVLSTPSLSTVASTQRATTGDRVYDTVKVRGLSPGDSVWVQWRLHGPMAPRKGSCQGLAWSRAAIADQGVFSATGNRDYRSGTTLIKEPGCYTYSESMAATTTTEPANSRPGIAVETFLATRPDVPGTPSIPSGNADEGDQGDGVAGGPALAQADVQADPRYLYRRYEAPKDLVTARPGATLRIPSAGIDAPIDAVGLDGRTMAIPNNPARLGWFNRSAQAGDVMGSSVISGHVSDRRDRPGVFARLGRVRVGDRIQWVEEGRTRTFRVTGRASYSRAKGVPSSVFDTTGDRVLRLVTCTNRRSAPGGGFHYASNLVITAVPQ